MPIPAIVPQTHRVTSALVMESAFHHHGSQQSISNAPWSLPAKLMLMDGEAVAESENIVAETAERIFADLADAQTINNDKDGRWKDAVMAGADRTPGCRCHGCRKTAAAPARASPKVLAF